MSTKETVIKSLSVAWYSMAGGEEAFAPFEEIEQDKSCNSSSWGADQAF